MNALALRRSALRTLTRTLLPSAIVPRRTFITIIEQGKEGWRPSLGRDPVRRMHAFRNPLYSQPTATLRRQLELQIEAESNRRKQLLDTSNDQRRRGPEAATAHRQIQRSRPRSSQIDALAEAVAAPGTPPGPGGRKRALNALVELCRLEQPRTIAKGSGNATYFFGDRAALGLGSGAGNASNLDYAEHVKGGLAKGKGRFWVVLQRCEIGAIGLARRTLDIVTNNTSTLIYNFISLYTPADLLLCAKGLQLHNDTRVPGRTRLFCERWNYKPAHSSST
ncbi:hypothetical protein DFH08DRAFT_1037147 [Mycena albidolilacea]|uniref:Uncharacterized protein n=1 Tax=Mycena albidolilacea TaxID=1033008 RepID=A0AAD7EEI6_9AGAR|nr:hypothetical protein DFH08DRAFT_1037147 [Mycena albidolilacea]